MSKRTLIIAALATLFLTVLDAPAQSPTRGLSVEEVARSTGNTVAVTKKFLDAGFVYDPSDNSLATPDSAGKPIPRQPRYIYFSHPRVLQFVDQNGEVHFVAVDLHRYDPARKQTWAQTRSGQWIRIK